MKKVKFGKPIIEKEEMEAINMVLGGDILVHGPKAKEFEHSFAKWTKAPFAISTSSCTAALHLAYFHLGIGPGDEVIVPAQTHVATAHAVELVGAVPVFVDAELITGNINIDLIEEKISKKTKAISIVHFLGMPVRMEKLMPIVDKYNLRLIEDCAIALGSWYKNKHVGLFGDVGCFSFYPVKHITTAEGGMMITNSEHFAASVQRKKAFGVDRTHAERKVPGIYDVNLLGFNYRMSELHACIGVEQMKKIDRFLSVRKENHAILHEGFSEIPEVHLLADKQPDSIHSHYCFSAILKNKLSEKRFEIVHYLNSKGIGTSTYYPKPVPEFAYYKNKYKLTAGEFPNARKISHQCISLPVGPHLNADDMSYIIENFKSAIKKYTI